MNLEARLSTLMLLYIKKYFITVMNVDTEMVKLANVNKWTPFTDINFIFILRF